MLIIEYTYGDTHMHTGNKNLVVMFIFQTVKPKVMYKAWINYICTVQVRNDVFDPFCHVSSYQ